MNDSYIRLSYEERLLLSICRLEFSDQQKSEIRELLKEIRDWDHFVKLANEHGIIAMCWYNINQIGATSDIPRGSLEILHSAYLKSLMRNTFLYNHLAGVASLANENNIKIVLLKGIALEKTVYGNKGFRQMSDIDILVRKDEAASLRRILLKNGFTTAPLVSRFHEKIMPAYGKHLPEMYKKGVAVEIHFRLFDDRENHLTEELFNTAGELPGDESKVCYPEPQLHFLYLIKHLEKHEKSGFSQLRLYTDLLVLLSLYSSQIINDRLFEYAKMANLENAVADKLILLNIYWGFAIPGHLKYSVEKFKTESVNAKFVEFLRHPGAGQDDGESESLGKLIGDVPGFINKLLLTTGHIFPSVSYIKYRYKIKTTFGAVLYYPVRWRKQLGKLISGRGYLF